MIQRSQRLPARLFLGGIFSLCLAITAWAEPGFIVVIKDTSGGAPTLRKVQKLERKGGFYVLQSAGKAPERFDAMNIGAAIDLSAFEPTTFDDPEDIQRAKAIDTATDASAKRYPQFAAQLAPYQAQLRREIERAERGEKKIDGKWLSPQEIATVYKGKKSTVNRGTLYLKNGTSYENVEILSATPQELRILHANGAATIPLDQVPEEFIKKNLTPATATTPVAPTTPPPAAADAQKPKK